MLKKIAMFTSIFLQFSAGIQLYSEIKKNEKTLPQTGMILNLGEHLLCCKSRDGKIELEDGTQLKVHPDQVETVLVEWDYHDFITISPNTNFFGGSDYYIENLTQGGFVHANFYNGPLSNNTYTMKIVYLDHNEGRISIKQENTDGVYITHWEVNPKDKHYLENWEIGETITLGMNNGWFSQIFSPYNFIMISYENLQFVKYITAKQLEDWR